MSNYQELFHLFISQAEDYAIFLLDPQGHVLTWNAGAQRIKGYEPDEIIGQHFSVFYPPDEPQTAADAVRIATETGHFIVEGWRVRKDGTRFWGSVVLTAIRGDSGELKGFAKITRDLTERRGAEEKLREAKTKFDLFMAGVKEYAIFMMDPEGRVIEWNAAAEHLLGYTEEEIIGQHFSVFFTPEEGEPGGIAEKELKIAVSVGRSTDDRWHVRKDGTHFFANGITSSLRDEAGNLRGFAKVLQDRTDRKRFEDELRLKNLALEEADRRKTEFLAMLAHELRNPLAPIATAVHLFEGNTSLSEEVREPVDILSRQVQKLTRLINDLMDVSRITSGKVQLDRQHIDLREAIQNAVETVTPLIQEHGHTFQVVLPDDPLWLFGDRTRLEQVFENLLSNGVKYTPEGGHIELTAERQNGRVIVSVRDNGVGIPPELLPHVFALFSQADQSLARSQGGLGIGLTIVQNLVELHDGDVSADSKGPGEGSEFIVRLPLFVGAQPLRPPSHPEGIKDGPQVRVLIVDDNRDAVKLLAMLLKRHEVKTALCGMEAIKIAAEFRPHVILLDIGLPGLDGYQVAQRLREQTDTKDTVLVALTGYGQPEDRQRSKEAGFDYHLVKPVAAKELEAIIRATKGP